MKKHNNTPIQSGRCITLLITAFLPVDGDGFHLHMGTIYTDSVHRPLASFERGAFCVLFSVLANTLGTLVIFIHNALGILCLPFGFSTLNFRLGGLLRGLCL